jgi:hypothetical protein
MCPKALQSELFGTYYYGDELTNKLTPRSRVIPYKVTDPQLLKKFIAFYGTRRFITAFKTASPYPE